MTVSRPDQGKAAVGTQSLQRAITLLRIIAFNNRSGSRLVDLYRRTGLERPTAHRLLQGMVAEKMARQDAQTKRYHLGSLAYELGLAASPKVALRDICLPYLDAVVARTGATAFLTVRSGFDGVCVARVDGTLSIKMLVHDVGRHRPLNVGASGLALLSALSDDEIERICCVNVERTRRKNPRYTEAALRTSIARTRRCGYTICKVLDEPLVHSVGMVILLPDSTPAAGVSILTLAANLGQDWLERAVRCLDEAVTSIEAELRGCLDRHRVPYTMPSLALA